MLRTRASNSALEQKNEMEEVQASKEMVEIYSDLVKIGIPSLVAIVGAVASFVLALKNIRKDVLIENLRIEKDLEEERNKRAGAIIEEVSSSISEIQYKLSQYASRYAAKIDVVADGLPFPPEEKQRLSTYYDQLNKTLQLGASTRTKLHLLGKEELISCFDSYWKTVTYISAHFAPHDRNRYEEVMASTLENEKRNRELMGKLSEVFLLKSRL